MPSVLELGKQLQVPIEEVIKMGEAQVLNSDSRIYQALVNQIAVKFAAIKADDEKAAVRKGKSRVYIQHSVSAADRYEFVQQFPNLDIVFSGVDKRGAARYRAIQTLVVEHILNTLPVKRGNVVGFGFSNRSIVMRGRHWLHLCVPGHIAAVQSELYRDDRAIVAIVNKGARLGRVPTTATKYLTGTGDYHCTRPYSCDVQGQVGVMLLTKCDTNFRQIAVYMRQHGVSLQYIIFPGNKDMEMCSEGRFDELDGYVFPSEGATRVNIVFAGDQSATTSYSWNNYLELVARTRVVLDGKTYHKEFHGRYLGMMVYKITCFDGVFTNDVPEYKSWMDPDYKSKYMVYGPVLKEGGSVDNPSDWSVKYKPVEISVMDDVYDFGMRAQGAADLDKVIMRRLFSRTSNLLISSQVLKTDGTILAADFDWLALVLYVSVFMAKFHDGATVRTIAPYARQMARMSKATNVQISLAFASALMSNMVRQLSVITAPVRKAYYDTYAEADLPMPCYSLCPGYVAYSDNASSNPRFRGWTTPNGDPTFGFSNMLPGMNASAYAFTTDTYQSEAGSTIPPSITAIVTGNAFVNESGNAQFVEDDDMLDVIASGAKSIFNYVGKIFHDVDLEVVYTDKYVAAMDLQEIVESKVLISEALTTDVPQFVRGKSDDPQAQRLVASIMRDHNQLVTLHPDAYNMHIPFGVPDVSDVQYGGISTDPLLSFVTAAQTLFPNSMIMVTDDFESDRNYQSWQVLLKAIMMKIDTSKFDALKPEKVYRPMIRGHVAPDTRETLSSTVHVAVKRNTNTPAHADSMSIQYLWERAWGASLRVFMKPDTEEILKQLPYVGPEQSFVDEWVAKLNERQRNRVEGDDDFSFEQLLHGASKNHLALKAKTKPDMTASYETSVKMAQSIQFDPTGKFVAIGTPIIQQKVSREAELLKDNVLIMQRKSPADVTKFLNKFDWRPNAMGERRYLEIDYEMFDKSQGDRLADFYLRKCAAYGVLPAYIAFIRDHSNVRSVAAMKSGVKLWLRDQNASGAPYTLDRNNDISMLSLSEELEKIISSIEFIITMGDDVLVAVRGDIDVSGWESEVNRKFGLTMKVALHKHGYICSMDIVHYPDGRSRVVADVVKRFLSFMNQSTKDEEKMRERFISYQDSLKGIEDIRVQQYISSEVCSRLVKVLPTATPDAMMELCRGHAGCITNYTQFRRMYADEPITKYY